MTAADSQDLNDSPMTATTTTKGTPMTIDQYQELLRVIAHLPTTPTEVRAQIVNLLGDKPREMKLKEPEPAKVVETVKDFNFALTEDESDRLNDLISDFEDASSSLESEVQDFNSNIENYWYQVDEAQDQYNSAINQLDEFISEVKDRYVEAGGEEEDPFFQSWNEVCLDEASNYEPDQLDEPDDFHNLRDLKALPTEK